MLKTIWKLFNLVRRFKRFEARKNISAGKMLRKKTFSIFLSFQIQVLHFHRIHHLHFKIASIFDKRGVEKEGKEGRKRERY